MVSQTRVSCKAKLVSVEVTEESIYPTLKTSPNFSRLLTDNETNMLGSAKNDYIIIQMLFLLEFVVIIR